MLNEGMGTGRDRSSLTDTLPYFKRKIKYVRGYIVIRH